ncbi:ADP-dependent phosphofructokinase/glucokinase [Promicromonospora sp. AC04]|uniref:ADP-dependent glucokinase/phosphofructokinase n=1 Tax=Promicromonospora sp. AC04 TaxID=2135723 RepID=UPI000D39987E|nr:ADP-dependent glucokinase/phosphofructokinase [Promicromonospora sp. AC04]PUB27052.1 ADP-dependent phosphofructokinase/glucokinase [Promicromonospora sp. AC04]
MSASIVLGLGGTVDYELAWDAEVLASLAAHHGIVASELDATIPVVDERSLVVSILGYLKDGVGGERFVTRSEILDAFAARFDTRVTLGGTCVRAAIAMRSLGVDSLVHLVSIDDHVRRLLPDGVSYVCSADADSTDAHLIVQYPAGAAIRVGDTKVVTEHPNRLIYVNDRPNRELVLSDELDTIVPDARVFLVSGFNTIQDPDLLEDRLRHIERLLGTVPAGGVSIFEDAGYHEPAFSLRVREVMASAVDVYSLNEDELFAYLGRRFDLLDADAVEQALRDIAALIPAPCLVIHTKHWALALGERGQELAEAVRGGILMASTRYLVGDGQTAQDYARTAAMDPPERGIAFARELERRFGARLACRPALALTTPTPTTIGLGDSFVGGFIAVLAAGGESQPGKNLPL